MNLRCSILNLNKVPTIVECRRTPASHSALLSISNKVELGRISVLHLIIYYYGFNYNSPCIFASITSYFFFSFSHKSGLLRHRLEFWRTKVQLTIEMLTDTFLFRYLLKYVSRPLFRKKKKIRASEYNFLLSYTLGL